MKRWSKLLGLLTALSLVLVGCGGNGGTETTAAPATTQASTPATTTGSTMAATTMAPGAEVATDVGVDLDAGTISVGLLSDLSGPFSPLVQVIVSGQEAYWKYVNDNGGINGLQVVPDARDTAYNVDQHVQLYEELKTQVVAFAHSTGSPQTVAINPQLQADGILAIPLTWYSGWSDPAINSNLVPHGTPYCIEAMDMLGYMANQVSGASTLAIASDLGDYGEDSAIGAKTAAEQLGLEVVYDGQGKINASDPATLTDVASGIAGSGADLVWVTTNPTAFGSIYGQAIQTGFEAAWSGAGPDWSPALVAPDSAIKDALARDMYVSGYYAPWAYDTPGNQAVRDLVAKYAPADSPPLDFYAEGVIEAKIMEAALRKAYDNGDMTQSGVLAAAKSLESVTFDGLAPDESYSGDPNSIVQRKIYVSRPDPDGLAAGTSTGLSLQEAEYTSDVAANYNFTEACYTLSE